MGCTDLLLEVGWHVLGWMDLGVQPFGICTLWCPMGPRSTQCPFAMPASQLLPILLLEGWPFQISGRFAQHSRCPYGWREGSFFAEFSVKIPPFRKEFSTALALAPLHRTQFGNHAGAAGATHSAAECWFGCVPVRGARGRPRRGRQTISLFPFTWPNIDPFFQTNSDSSSCAIEMLQDRLSPVFALMSPNNSLKGGGDRPQISHTYFFDICFFQQFCSLKISLFYRPGIWNMVTPTLFPT